MAVEWVQRRMQAALVVGGQSLQCLADSVEDSGIEPVGGLIPAADGTTSYQVRGGDERPLSARGEISIDLVVTTEADYMLLRGILAQAAAAPLRLWLDLPMVESWVIATARTSWPLRRATAFDLVPIATYSPRAFVGTTELTLVATSPPTAGEFFVSAAVASAEIETADLSASAGELLTLRYHPLRELGQVEVQWAHADEDVGMWTVSITAQEHVR